MEPPLDFPPQRSRGTLETKFASLAPVESPLAYANVLIEGVDVASNFLGPHLPLPPPEQLMTAFESRWTKTVTKRKKAYNEEERKKVGQVRRKGACWQCQIRKIAVCQVSGRSLELH